MSRIDRKEILISRVVGREEQPTDWQELRNLAAQDANLWQRVLVDLESESWLRAACSESLQFAQRVELPLPSRRREWTQSIAAFINPLGWIAALVMGLFWIATPDRYDQAPVREITATIPITSEGDFVTELPRVLVSSGLNEVGDAFELMYMRRFIERVQVDQILRMRVDDAGQAFATAVSPADYRPTQSY